MNENAIYFVRKEEGCQDLIYKIVNRSVSFADRSDKNDGGIIWYASGDFATKYGKLYKVVAGSLKEPDVIYLDEDEAFLWFME